VAGLGILVTWFGYSVLYYGVTQVQGGNWGYLDLIAPGRWTAAVAATPRDAPGGTATVAGGLGSAVPTAGNPAGVNVWNATTAPAGAPPGNYRVNQDGTIEVQAPSGGWTVYSTPGSTGGAYS